MIYYLLPVALGLIFVLGLGYRGWPDARSRALSALRRAPNVAIAEIEDGRWAKITGVVSALGPPMTSPFSDQPCIGFRLLVESVKPGLAPGVLAQRLGDIRNTVDHEIFRHRSGGEVRGKE